MPLLSIVIPAHNVALELPAAIASLQALPDQNWEVICINDGSKDRTLRVAMGAAQADPRVRVIHQAKQGIDRACRAGMEAALGEWVAFVSPSMLLQIDDLRALRAAVLSSPHAVAFRMSGEALLGACVRRDLMLTDDAFQISSTDTLAHDIRAQLTSMGRAVIPLNTPQVPAPHVTHQPTVTARSPQALAA